MNVFQASGGSLRASILSMPELYQTYLIAGLIIEAGNALELGQACSPGDNDGLLQRTKQ